MNIPEEEGERRIGKDRRRNAMTGDDYRRNVREAMIEYLKDHTTQQERKDLFKSALSEWLRERFAEFGWFSFKTLAVVAFGAAMYMWLIMGGFRK